MQTSELFERGVLARDRIAAQIPDRDHQIVEEAALPARNRAPMTLERDLVLILTSDLPLLSGDLGVLAHAQAGRAVRHGWDVQTNVSDPELCDVRRLVRERARLLKLPDPIGERLSEAQLHAAHALHTADQGEIAIDAVDHSCRLDRSDHARRAS